ncbi:hypothetical protein [Ahniella affigens]|uniref:hypothetical protein n=1 Tax=Ahniella affigens TaxID=2021234 RepID=UPI0011B25518|nr:hypothetical protein [Ahniella affigens]
MFDERGSSAGLGSAHDHDGRLVQLGGVKKKRSDRMFEEWETMQGRFGLAKRSTSTTCHPGLDSGCVSIPRKAGSEKFIAKLLFAQNTKLDALPQ